MSNTLYEVALQAEKELKEKLSFPRYFKPQELSEQYRRNMQTLREHGVPTRGKVWVNDDGRVGCYRDLDLDKTKYEGVISDTLGDICYRIAPWSGFSAGVSFLPYTIEPGESTRLIAGTGLGIAVWLLGLGSPIVFLRELVMHGQREKEFMKENVRHCKQNDKQLILDYHQRNSEQGGLK